MIKTIFLVGLVAFGWWYYTGPYQADRMSPAQQGQKNLQFMNSCMRQEARMAAGAGMAGVMSDAGDVEAICADKLGLELRDGEWQEIRR